MDTIHELPRELPVVAEFQVVVIGGGIAGAAAALAAARRGCSVALIEKQCGIGGLATLGNILVYLPLCDGNGTQVISGIAEELLHRSVKDIRRNDRTLKLRPVPDCWKTGGETSERCEQRLMAEFNPTSFQLELEAMLQEEGVEIFFDTRFCEARTDGRRVTHAILENKSGRLAIAGAAFIDASGDADLCHVVGEETESLDSNVISGWHYYIVDGEAKQRPFSFRYNPRLTRDASSGPFFRGDVGKDVSAHVLATHAEIRKFIDQQRAANPDQWILPIGLPAIPSFRATRRLKTSFSPCEEHMHQWFDDCIGLTGDWRKRGPVYALPLRSIRAERHRNLFAAGRCISVDTSIWDVTRVIPTCALTGEAAGVAATMVQAGAELDCAKLQDELRSTDNLITPDLLED